MFEIKSNRLVTHNDKIRVSRVSAQRPFLAPSAVCDSHRTTAYEYPVLLSNCLSNVQITHSNVKITSTNTQRYCTVQNRIFNRFGETVATARHDNFWINYCSFSWKSLIDSFFFQPIKILHLIRHAPRVTRRVSRAFFLFRYVYKIHYRNSWIVNNLLDI